MKVSFAGNIRLFYRKCRILLAGVTELFFAEACRSFWQEMQGSFAGDTGLFYKRC